MDWFIVPVEGGRTVKISVQTYLRRAGFIFGVDLTPVTGISVLTAHTILSEVGPDISKFRSASAFASWLGLCPHNDISGGRILSAKTRRVRNRAAVALRMAANPLFKSQSPPLGDVWLGTTRRRICLRLSRAAPRESFPSSQRISNA
jgi:transposase